MNSLSTSKEIRTGFAWHFFVGSHLLARYNNRTNLLFRNLHTMAYRHPPIPISWTSHSDAVADHNGAYYWLANAYGPPEDLSNGKIRFDYYDEKIIGSKQP